MPLPIDTFRMLRRSVSESFDLFGHDVELRKFISASAGVPEAGIGDTWMYQKRTIRVDFRPLTFEEVQAIGGQEMRGGYEVFSVEDLDPRDELVFDGHTYRCVSQSTHEHIGSPLWHQSFWMLGEVTGTY